MSTRPYHTLIRREDGEWIIEFGDYDKGVVADELDEYRDKGIFAKNLKIITTSDKQQSIEAEVARINEEQRK